MSKSRGRRTLAAIAALAVGVGTAGLSLIVAPEPASAAPTPVTITPNPWYANEAFEGWGTSLVWFANATGGYPPELREQLYQAVFGEDGLDLNIARYNIGGGNASDVPGYLRAGGAVEGYWAADPTGSLGTYGGVSTSYADRAALLAAYDPTDDSNYDFTNDATQQWWVERLAEDNQITHWETFANSAPYFMTQSGYVSGGTNATAEQLNPAASADFAEYLVRVTEHLEDEYGISVESIDPLNEPNTSYWKTTVTNGVPSGGQEGMHVGPAAQATLIDNLAAVLSAAGTTTDAYISSPDETNPTIFATDWAAYNATTRANVERMNVHTYGTSDRLVVRDLSKQSDKNLWMSEVEGSFVTGYNPLSIDNGLGMAGRIMDDLRELEPSAWVFWQPVEDLYNMEPGKENANWGSIQIDLDCTAYVENGVTVYKSARRVAAAGGVSTGVEPCSVKINSKFNAVRNFTKFIHEGDYIIPTNDTTSTAALNGDGTGATIVHSNPSTSEQRITLDLSKFGTFANGATVTPYVTTQANSLATPTSNSLVQGAAVAVDVASKSAVLTVPAKSIVTFVVSGVSGVAPSAAAIDDGSSYQFVGVQSGKALTATPAGTVKTTITTPATTSTAAATQVWTAHEVPDGEQDAAKKYVFTTSSGAVLGATTAGTDLRSISLETAMTTPQTTWFVNTTNGSTYSFVNAGIAQAIEVGGQSTAENASVGVYGSNGGANQTWTIRSLVPSVGQTVAVRTEQGTAPALPTTVTPTYAWGTGAAATATWPTVSPSQYSSSGNFTVTGSATNIYGVTYPVTASVDVGAFFRPVPASLTVQAGTTLASVIASAPTTVQVEYASGNRYDSTATWDFSGVTDSSFASPGTVNLYGEVAATGGGTVSGSLSVIVTPVAATNFALESTVVATATSTEGAYAASNTKNGVSTDKGWSNWVSTNKPTQSTLTYTFAAVRPVNGIKTTFYKDGTNSWAQSIQFQYLNASNVWTSLPGYATAATVTAPSTGPAPVVSTTFPTVQAKAVRVVMNAYALTHLTVSETEIYQPVPASVSTLRELWSNDEFLQVSQADHTVGITGSQPFPVVRAYPTDTAATTRITQPSAANNGVGTVLVTAADGVTTTTYHVTVTRTPVINGISIDGEAAIGQTVSASATTDPSDAQLSYRWFVDGAEVAGATSSDFEIPTTAGGAALTVEVTASAAGFSNTATLLSDVTTIEHAPPATPVVTGTLAVGSALSADAGIWDAGTQLSYQWLRNGEEIEHATDASYTLVGDDYDRTIAVRVTGVVGDGEPVSVTSNGQTVGTRGALAAGTVTISGSPELGETLTAEASTWTPADTALAYQWSVGGVDVENATDATYEIAIGDVGKVVSVAVTGTRYGYNDATISGSSDVVSGTTIVTEEPTITGTPMVGVELTADPGTWQPGTTTFTYQWLVNGVEVLNATGETYTPTAADFGLPVSVRVTGSADAFDSHFTTSVPTANVAAGVLLTAVPTIDGSVVVDQTLTAVEGSWADGTQFSYQWSVDGDEIEGATASTFLLLPEYVTKTVTVAVTGALYGYESDTVSSEATGAVAAAPMTPATPGISGQPVVGASLTAVVGAWAPAGVALSYQWSVDGDEVDGATAVHYTVAAGDAGKRVTVAVSGTKTGYLPDSATSAPTAVVIAASTEGYFADVTDTSSLFYAPIQWMYASSLSLGTAQPTGKPLYKPSDAVSRQATAAFLYRLSGATFTAPAEPTFSDVDSSSQFYTAVEWMAAEGISTGTPVTGAKPAFKPTDAVSRQALAVLLARYVDAPLSGTPTAQSFADVPVNASTAAAIQWMATSGVATGTAQPSGLPLFKPADPVSRQAMAVFLYRVAQL